MTRTVGVLLVALLVTPCAAQWTGTIASRPVTCTIVPGPFPVAPMGGDAAVVTTLGLWCRGTRRHAVQALVYATDRAGTLALTGHLCRRGPRPAAPRARLRQCCTLARGTFAGSFTPAYPPDEQTGPVLLTTGDLTALQLGASCRRVTLPIGAVTLARD